MRRNSAFGQIEERPPYVQHNPDGSVTYRRVPRTSAEAIEMVYEDWAKGGEAGMSHEHQWGRVRTHHRYTIHRCLCGATDKRMRND